MTTEFQDELIFTLDFNNVAEDGKLVKTSLYAGASRRIPRRDERVFLRDAEGNHCWGWVRDIRGALLFVEVDESTWVFGQETRVIPVYGEGRGFSYSWAVTDSKGNRAPVAL